MPYFFPHPLRKCSQALKMLSSKSINQLGSVVAYHRLSDSESDEEIEFEAKVHSFQGNKKNDKTCLLVEMNNGQFDVEAGSSFTKQWHTAMVGLFRGACRCMNQFRMRRLLLGASIFAIGGIAGGLGVAAWFGAFSGKGSNAKAINSTVIPPTTASIDFSGTTSGTLPTTSSETPTPTTTTTTATLAKSASLPTSIATTAIGFVNQNVDYEELASWLAEKGSIYRHIELRNAYIQIYQGGGVVSRIDAQNSDDFMMFMENLLRTNDELSTNGGFSKEEANNVIGALRSFAEGLPAAYPKKPFIERIHAFKERLKTRESSQD
jgi:hypothetical protein